MGVHVHVHIQWNLQMKNILGQGVLYFIEGYTVCNVQCVCGARMFPEFTVDVTDTQTLQMYQTLVYRCNFSAHF